MAYIAPNYRPEVKNRIKRTLRDGEPWLDITGIFSGWPIRYQNAINEFDHYWRVAVGRGEMPFDIIVALPPEGLKLVEIFGRFSGCPFTEMVRGEHHASVEYAKKKYKSRGGNTKHLQIRVDSLIPEDPYMDIVYVHESRKVLVENDEMMRIERYKDWETELLPRVKGKRVMFTDGFLTNGLKVSAAAELVSDLGMIVAGYSCVAELKDIGSKIFEGRDVLEKRGVNVASLLIYDERIGVSPWQDGNVLSRPPIDSSEADRNGPVQ